MWMYKLVTLCSHDHFKFQFCLIMQIQYNQYIINTLTLWMLLCIFMLTSCPCGRSFYCSLETLKHHGKLDNCHIQNTHVIKWVMRNSDTGVPFFGYTEIPKCLNVSYFNLKQKTDKIGVLSGQKWPNYLLIDKNYLQACLKMMPNLVNGEMSEVKQRPMLFVAQDSAG